MSRRARLGTALIGSALIAGTLVATSPAAYAANPEVLTTYSSGGHPVVTSTGQHLILFLSASRFSTDGTSDAGDPGTVTVRLMTKDFAENHSWTFNVSGGSFTNTAVQTGTQAKPYAKVHVSVHRTSAFNKQTCDSANFENVATVTTRGTLAFKTHNAKLGNIAKRHFKMTHGTLVAGHGPDLEEACIRHNPCKAGTQWSVYHAHVTLTGDSLSSPKRAHPKSTIQASRFVHLNSPKGATRFDDVISKAPLPKLFTSNGHPALRAKTTAGTRAHGKALLVSTSKSPYQVPCKTGTERGKNYETSWHGVIKLHAIAFGALRVRKASIANFFTVTIH